MATKPNPQRLNHMTDQRYQHDWYSGWKAILVIVSLMFLWGGVLSIGALLHPGSNWIRAVIITSSVSLFVAFWISIAAARNSR
jgi:hypothetical protein